MLSCMVYPRQCRYRSPFILIRRPTQIFGSCSLLTTFKPLNWDYLLKINFRNIFCQNIIPKKELLWTNALLWAFYNIDQMYERQIYWNIGLYYLDILKNIWMEFVKMWIFFEYQELHCQMQIFWYLKYIEKYWSTKGAIKNLTFF